MFERARVQLTFWYLLIIMTISILFSIGMYLSIHREYQRFEKGFGEGRRLLLHVNGNIPSPQDILFLNEQAVSESRSRVIMFLVVTNGIILVVSGTAGYFLAGRTLRPIQQMLDKQNRFIQDASHELRTPLTSLRAEIEVELQNKTLSKEITDLLTSNLEEVIRLQTLSDSLLSLVQNTPQSSHFSRLNLKHVLKDAIKRIEPLAKQKNIIISHTLTSVEISGIKERLRDVFIILLDNAVKYSPDSSTVTVRLKKDKQKATLTITDKGIGIDAKDLPHIFERFYRVRTSRSKDFVEGFGLGLPIAKKIIAEHRGTIDIKSSPTHGSTFTITLPL